MIVAEMDKTLEYTGGDVSVVMIFCGDGGVTRWIGHPE